MKVWYYHLNFAIYIKILKFWKTSIYRNYTCGRFSGGGVGVWEKRPWDVSGYKIDLWIFPKVSTRRLNSEVTTLRRKFDEINSANVRRIENLEKSVDFVSEKYEN